MSAQRPKVKEIPMINLENMGVHYNLSMNKKRQLRDSIVRDHRRSQPGEFWALRDINLQMHAGETLAVIGHNGAGKSTLLQVLAGILEPTVGIAEVRGSIATLLSLGAGFDPTLTARENISLVGDFLGVPHREMLDRLPSIIEFAGLEDFADDEVRGFSSGMKARLGFSVATSVKPDVLLLDEVLAAGDADFLERSKRRIEQLIESASVMVLVTHSLESAAKFCTRTIELEKGQIVADGPTRTIVGAYKKKMAKRAATASRSDQAARRGS
jgi:ABC-type polysaccharide/polyol phosphate transport system ATPase subunit